jgi:hypothetical protein
MRIPEEDTAGTDNNLVLPHDVHGNKVLTGKR